MMKKASFLISAVLFCFLLSNTNSFAGSIKNKIKTPAKKRISQSGQIQTAIWQQVSEEILKSDERERIAPDNFLLFRLNKTALTKILNNTPSEFSAAVRDKSQIMDLPLPDGTLVRVKIEESSVLEPGLAARFPELKSYRGQGVDDAALTTRFDWTPQGFHALILNGGQTINLEPSNTGDDSLYISYYASDLKKGDYACLVKDIQNLEPGLPQLDAPQVSVGTTLRNYRIAIATDYEYTQAYGGGSVAQTVSTLNTWVNGANAIYERDLAIHLNLVNNTDIIYTTTGDPYDNNNVVNMLSTVISDLNDKVGAPNYDIGHVMGYLGGGASGVAYVGVVCQTGFKGGGATLMGGSAGNSSTLGVWVHELGHEFGASHNFNGSLGNCAGSNRSAASSYESGSGSTIMGYPQICSTDNIANNRDLRFHAMSYAAINSYISGTGSCSINTPTSNSAPTVNGGGNRNIPKNTPFTLTASASDPNGDALTYTWDEIDAGGSSYPQNGTSASYNDAGDPSTTTRPIFRPFAATTSPSRTFPSLTYILNYSNDPPDFSPTSGLQTAEELPRIGRLLNFRVTARDNRTGGGGVNEDTVTLTVDNNSGPFLVTSPNSSVNFSGGTAQTVSWSVNNTNAAPVSAANVKISLSTDGGNTFPTVLSASTPNDGNESVILPNITTSTARIKVEAVNNIFFDINDANFSITAGTVSQTYEADVNGRPNGDGFVDGSDIQQIRQFSVGMGTPYQSNEFQRADCAPRSSLGDGFVDGDDVLQARRYSIGNDAVQLAGGPSAPSPIAPPVFDAAVKGKAIVRTKDGVQAAPAAFRVDAQNTTAGATLVVPIRVDTVGNEAGYTFSIAFDSTKLTNPIVAIGNGGGDVIFNANNAGQIGFSVTSFSGGTIAAANNVVLVNVTFTVAAGAPAGTTPITFTSTPARQKASGVDPNTPITQPTYTAGTITIGGATAAGATIGGRVSNGKGRGVANARVIVTNSTGQIVQTARTNGFGYYAAAEITAGETYIVSVESKQYKFGTRLVTVAQDVDGIDFAPQP